MSKIIVSDMKILKNLFRLNQLSWLYMIVPIRIVHLRNLEFFISKKWRKVLADFAELRLKQNWVPDVLLDVLVLIADQNGNFIFFDGQILDFIPASQFVRYHVLFVPFSIEVDKNFQYHWAIIVDLRFELSGKFDSEFLDFSPHDAALLRKYLNELLLFSLKVRLYVKFNWEVFMGVLNVKIGS